MTMANSAFPQNTTLTKITSLLFHIWSLPPPSEVTILPKIITLLVSYYIPSSPLPKVTTLAKITTLLDSHPYPPPNHYFDQIDYFALFIIYCLFLLLKKALLGKNHYFACQAHP